MAGDMFTRLGTYNMVLPPEGPKAYPFTLDFTTTNTQLLDFTSEIQRGFISWIQSVVVDNRLNANDLIITAEQTQFPLRIPAGKQAYMPVFVTDAARITFTTPQDGSLVVPCLVTNVPVQPIVF